VADSTEWRPRIDPLVRVHPDHAAADLAGEAVGPLQVFRPQPTAQAVLDRVGQGERLVVVVEHRHRDERPEHLLTGHPPPWIGPDYGGLDVTARGKGRILGSLPPGEDLAPFVEGDLDVVEDPVAMLRRG